jgi:hypothetical protein
MEVVCMKERPRKMDATDLAVTVSGISAIIALTLFLALTVYCRLTYKPDADLVAKVDEIIHRDPVIANALRNNTYTIRIVGADTYPYIDNWAVKCYVEKITAEVVLEKPVYTVLYGPTNRYYETRVIRVEVDFERGTAILYNNEPVGYTGP